ncbi:flagellar motor protein, partial [Erythrobacter sp. HI0038]
WLLGATTEDQRKGLADYFTPTLVKTKEQSAGADGVLGGSSLVDVDNYPHAAGQTGTQTLTVPRDATGGPKEGAASIRRIQQRVDDAIADKKRLERLMRQVRMIDTTTGIRIDLVDDADFSMFSLGTTVLTTDARELLDLIAQAIGPEGGKITVRGHTDALKYRDPSRVNNWSLSAGRAETTRQNLIRHGIVRERFRRIEGVADTEPLIADDPSDPRNRRISITLERS